MKVLLLSLAALAAVAVPVGYSLATADADTGPAPADDAAPASGDAASTQDEAFAHTQTIDLAVVAPYPACPLQCSVGYGFMGSGGLTFVVLEGATRVVVTATWTPTTPASETLDVSLARRDPSCGEGCHRGVADAQGARSVTFELADPEPGDHLVWAGPTGPAGAALRQDVHLEVAVHYS